MPDIRDLRNIITPLLTPEGLGVNEMYLVQKGLAFADQVMGEGESNLTRYTNFFLRAAIEQVTGMPEDEQLFFNLFANSALSVVSTFGAQNSAQVADEFKVR